MGVDWMRDWAGASRGTRAPHGLLMPVVGVVCQGGRLLRPPFVILAHGGDPLRGVFALSVRYEVAANLWVRLF